VGPVPRVSLKHLGGVDEFEGTLFSDESFVAAYRRSRTLVPTARLRYSTLIARSHAGRGPLLDVGSGPNPLSFLLPAELMSAGETWLLDRSAPMLLSALHEAVSLPSQRRIIACNAPWQGIERLEQVFQLIILSDFCHLVEEVDLLAQILIDALAPGGRLLIRHVPVDRIPDHSWYEGFPDALEIDQERNTRVTSLLRRLRKSGLRLIERETVDESRRYEPADWIGRLQSRCYSTLHALDADQLTQGLWLQRRLHPTAFRSRDNRDAVILEKSAR
jgi:SAM-dependent methyltransferase